jgi:polysaccharide deacetylase family sporulation protein PdaB
VKFIWIINGKKIKQGMILAVAALFAVGILYMERKEIDVFAQKEPAAIYKVSTNEKKIALTFDISWGNERLLPILEVLEKEGVKNATFFLSGQWSKEHPDLVKKIQEKGFEIGSHGNKHTNYSRLSEEEIREQIQIAHRNIKEVTGKDPKLIRFPNGDLDKRVIQIADELNYTVIQWDTNPRDWENPGVQKIVDHVLENAHPGDIILLHSSDSVKQTHLALPTIIRELKKQGYQFVTVSELISGVHAEVNELD